MTKKTTSLGEVAVLHSPSFVWCVEKVRKGRNKNVTELSILRVAE